MENHFSLKYSLASVFDKEIISSVSSNSCPIFILNFNFTCTNIVSVHVFPHKCQLINKLRFFAGFDTEQYFSLAENFSQIECVF